jgi:hypothetical protein
MISFAIGLAMISADALEYHIIHLLELRDIPPLLRMIHVTGTFYE